MFLRFLHSVILVLSFLVLSFLFLFFPFSSLSRGSDCCCLGPMRGAGWRGKGAGRVGCLVGGYLGPEEEVLAGWRATPGRYGDGNGGRPSRSRSAVPSTWLELPWACGPPLYIYSQTQRTPHSYQLLLLGIYVRVSTGLACLAYLCSMLI